MDLSDFIEKEKMKTLIVGNNFDDSTTVSDLNKFLNATYREIEKCSGYDLII